MSQKPEQTVSSLVADTSRRLQQLAEPRPVGDTVKAAIRRAARAARLSYWRAFDIWYGKARRIDAAEVAAIREAEVARSRGAQRELFELARDFEALAQRAARIDPQALGKSADALRSIAGRVRGLAGGE